MKIAFITNICSHYRVKTFEILNQYLNPDFYFFSEGKEWYWQQQHGVKKGGFHFEYLPGFRLGETRVTPTLPWKLWQGNYDVYIKCINGRFALPITYIISRMKRKPFILWTGIWMRLHTPFHRLFFPLTCYIYKHADAIVVYGDHVGRYLISEGVKPERIFAAYHAVDNQAYNCQVDESTKTLLRKTLNIHPVDKVVLYLGRLEKVKGLNYLFQAFASLKRDNIILVIAGTGSERNNLEQLAHQLDIFHKVRFPGYIETNNAVSYYSIANIYVLPSITRNNSKETWGLVINEAFNQGVPVIATDAVGAAAGGLVQDGINGFIVPERDSIALARAIEKILDYPDLRTQLSKNARKRIQEWDNEKMVMGFRRAIEFIMAKR